MRRLLLGLMLALCFVLFMAPESLAKPPVPEVPDGPQVRCYKFEEDITISLPNGVQVTTNHFEYAVWLGLEQFKNNKNKLVVVPIGYEVWTEEDGLVLDAYEPGTDNFPFPSCGPS